jgi:hypothetical protein
MPYNLNYFDGRAFITLADGVVDQQASSSLYLIGKDVTSYGTLQNDNFLWLTENFAGTVEPVNKVQGQIWFDKNAGVLRPKIYDGSEWRTFGMMTAGLTGSVNAAVGDFWYKTDTDQLYIRNSSNYSLIGPESVPGFGRTKFLSSRVLDAGNDPHACIIMYADGVILGAISNDEFDVGTAEELYSAGITFVGRGFNFVSGATIKSEDVYLKSATNEVITGRWRFSNVDGISFGSSAILENSSDNLVLQATGKSIILTATDIVPVNNSTLLGSAANKFAKVFASEFNAGSSISSANLIGKFILATSSKLEPGNDGAISLGAANARFGTLFTLGVNAGGTTENASITGNWALSAGSSINTTAGTLAVSSMSAETITTTVINAESVVTPSISIQSASVSAGLTANTISTPSLTAATISSTNIGADVNVSAPRVTSQLISAGNANATGEFEGKWSFRSGSTLALPAGTTASWADIAERYGSDQQYESGTVVMFGGTSEVTIANLPSTTKVAGIITTEPAQILNSELENSVAIALVGRVPCKVVGIIFKGDMLVVSDIPGVLTSSAMPKPGSIVAKAMQYYSSEEVGVIEVMVTRG